MNTQVNKVRDVFDDWARRGRAEGMEKGHGPAARQAFDRLGIGPGTNYLDIGCGNGYTVRWAAETAPNVRAIGIDVSPEMIDRARAMSVHLPNAIFECDAFPASQLARGNFTAIFSMEVFYYLPDLGAGLEEVSRLLASGGRFACVVDYYLENPESHSWPDEMNLSLQLLSQDEWVRAMQHAGLRVEEQARLHPPLEPGAQPTWKHEVGSLLTLAVKP